MRGGDQIETYSRTGKRVATVQVSPVLDSFDIQADGKLAFADNDSRVFAFDPRRWKRPRHLYTVSPPAYVRLAADRVVLSAPREPPAPGSKILLSDLRGERSRLGRCSHDSYPDWNGRAATWHDGRILYWHP